MFVTYRHTNIQTNIHTYIQTLWLPESLDLLDRETEKRKRLKNSGNENGNNMEDESVLDESLNKRNKKDEINETSTSCETSMNVDEDDSIFEDMTYKNILEKEFEITSNLEKMFTDVANNLKYKKNK